ncbi:DUF3325 domain-containing protein [Pseudomonas sp. R1-18]|uniref:DUF3325 domain-containing protein n=1 Tax=Pseudomonas sp. R1-18 TaxID=1632772 RepID=UPI003DA863F3
MSLALLTAALLASSGMFGLCLGLERHHRQLLQRPPRAGLLRALRALGWLALAASFASSVASWGWAMGPVGWFGLVSLTGLALVMLSPYVMRWLIALLFIGWLVVGLLTLF